MTAELSPAPIRLLPADVLLVTDVQNDFCPGGALPVPDGDAVVEVVNTLARTFQHVVLTQDWHPAGHRSHVSSQPGAAPFSTIRVAYGEQILWPDHCVQGTPGAEFHPRLDRGRAQLILRKGHHRDIDSYSAFFENDHRTRTGLAGYLRDRGLDRVFVCGLAFDFCVKWSALDARREGFETLVIEDACRSIDLAGSHAAAVEEMLAAGVRLVSSTALLAA